MPADARINDKLEPPGEHPRPVIAVAAGILIVLAVSFAALFWFYQWRVPHQDFEPPRAYPSPGVIRDEAGELQRLQAAQQKQLQGYRWIDRSKEIAAIPIERAMAIIAQRGPDGYAPIGQHGAAAAPPTGQSRDRNAPAAASPGAAKVPPPVTGKDRKR